MSVSEYCDRFTQLSRYAPEEVDTDDKPQERFLEGLIGPLNYQLQIHCGSPRKLSGPRAPILALMASDGYARVPGNLTRLSRVQQLELIIPRISHHTCILQ
jgi:hypothetical protein